MEQLGFRLNEYGPWTPLTTQAVAYTGTAGATDTVSGTQTTAMRLVATTDCWVTVVSQRSGTFTLNPDSIGNTAAIPAAATAAEIQAALVAVTGAGKITVTGTGTVADKFIITFIGTLGLSARTLTKVSTGVVDATATLATVQVGDGSHNASYSLCFTATLATNAGMYLPAAIPAVFRVPTQCYVSAIQVASGGTLYCTEMTK